MRAKAVRVLAILVYFYALGAASVLAQAILSVGSAPTTATDIGYTELAGQITFSVFVGTTAADHVLVIYSAPITNNAASDISVIGTGSLSAVSIPVLDRNQNAILFNIPAGGSPGNTVSINGVRLQVAGLNITQATASIFTSANTITSAFPVVINNVMQPFLYDDSGAQPLSYAAGIATNGTSSFVIAELFESAFKGMTGIGGQTVPTMIRITPFLALPDGTQITFNEVATATTGATLMTLSGTSETIPRSDGSTNVDFIFIPAPTSDDSIESFQIKVSLTQPPATGWGAIRFQAALIPFGAAVPDQDYPSTDIPRYAKRLLPAGADMGTGTTQLFFPFRIGADNTYTGIAITNPNNYQVKGTLSAFDTDGNLITGSGIANPVNIIVAKNGQYAKTASEVFGLGFDRLSAGMIAVHWRFRGIKGLLCDWR